MINLRKKWRTAVLAGLCATLLAWPSLGQDLGRVDLGGRHYFVDLPDRDSAPLIVLLHGGGGNPVDFAKMTGFVDEALLRGYAVVLPAGTPMSAESRMSWNAGYCCGTAARQNVDDIGFLTEVISDAVIRFGLSGRDVYLAGMSNGGMMAASYAAAHPASVKALASVSGPLDIANQKIKAAVPALFIHGTQDHLTPYQGGKGIDTATKFSFPPILSVAQAFAQANGEALLQSHWGLNERRDGTKLEVRDWSQGDHLRVRLMSVVGGGHSWPGGGGILSFMPSNSREIRANAMILDFFDGFRR